MWCKDGSSTAAGRLALIVLGILGLLAGVRLDFQPLISHCHHSWPGHPSMQLLATLSSESEPCTPPS